MENPEVNGTESGYSAGWGSVFNFSIEIWDPTRNKTNVSLWYSPTAGSGWMLADSQNVTLPIDSSPGNMTNFTMRFLCDDGSITDYDSNDLGVVGSSKYYKYEALNDVGFGNNTYDTYGNIIFTLVKDSVNVWNETNN